MPLFSLLRTNESTVKRRGGESEKVVTQISVLVFLGIEVFYSAKRTRKNEGKTSTDLTVSICGVKVFQYFNQCLDSNQNHVRLNMYTQPKKIKKIETLVKEVLQSSTQYADLSQEFERLFWEDSFYWEKLEDCYRKIIADWQNLDAENFKRIIKEEAKKYADTREDYTAKATCIEPLDTFDEFHIISGDNESEILQRVAAELGVPLADENLPVIYAELESLKKYVEELKDELKMLFYYDCISRLYKMAQEGSLFEEGSSKLSNVKLPKGQNGLTAARFCFIEYFSEGKLNSEPNEDKTKFYKRLSDKYGKTEEDFKKAIKRVNVIIDKNITESQKRYIKDDLKVVLEYFSNENCQAFKAKVEEFASSKKIYLNESN
ncbi:hypothetical protein [Runella sp. SP2]|uniref:hypothetical protein n=1 Tax=Runella sp. SP2 TaxID=2268026 RepID=UPI000F094E79|nr:hypothetical protein [Runella sp. SP2]AYQ31088.1 hypothetical protein DTQ70_02345 [Runella sp. SP2]